MIANALDALAAKIGYVNATTSAEFTARAETIEQETHDRGRRSAIRRDWWPGASGAGGGMAGRPRPTSAETRLESTDPAPATVTHAPPSSALADRDGVLLFAAILGNPCIGPPTRRVGWS
jgi:hypothetical protein